jgi:hypothetical protein
MWSLREGHKRRQATLMIACVDGSVFISKAIFMPGAKGKGDYGRTGLRESVCESDRVRGGNHGQEQQPKLW